MDFQTEYSYAADIVFHRAVRGFTHRKPAAILRGGVKQGPLEMAHDAVTRWLSGTVLSPDELWKHASILVKREKGYLILDDSIFDKPYSKQIPFIKAQ